VRHPLLPQSNQPSANNFVSTADGAAVIDVAPYFGHPEADAVRQYA